jgi:hypothetical protein
VAQVFVLLSIVDYLLVVLDFLPATALYFVTLKGDVFETFAVQLFLAFPLFFRGRRRTGVRSFSNSGCRFSMMRASRW